MSRTIYDINHLVTAWILGEKTEWREKALAIATTEPTNVPLHNFLLGLLQEEDSPGIRNLLAELDGQEIAALTRRGLPWINIWSFVGVDLNLVANDETKSKVEGET